MRDEVTEYQTAQAEPRTWLRWLWETSRLGQFRLYMLPGYGITYRVSMRIIHRFGWHWHKANPWLDHDPVHYWCHWCGDRYSEPKRRERL